MEYPKLISWSYRDGRGLFSSKNDKEFINLFYVRNAETEETIKKVGFIPSDALGPNFPGVYRQKEWGYSQRARSHGKIKKKFQKLYPDLEDKFLCKQANNGEDLNGTICARLCVDSWVNPLTKEYSEYFLSSKYIKASAFDDTKFVEDLLNYKPLALGSGVIKSYQEEELPNFIQSVKFYNQNLYKKLLSFDKVQELSKEFSPVGKTAKVHTLEPSKVWPVKDLFDYSNKYKKATIKESLQNYVLTQLNNGVNDVPLFFIFELKEFGKFDYSDFVDSLDKDVLKIIPTNLKKFFEEVGS